MKVKVIKSEYADINPGMIGEAVATSLEGFEVTFKISKNPIFNRPVVDQQVTVWMTRDQIENTGD